MQTACYYLKSSVCVCVCVVIISEGGVGIFCTGFVVMVINGAAAEVKRAAARSARLSARRACTLSPAAHHAAKLQTSHTPARRKRFGN